MAKGKPRKPATDPAVEEPSPAELVLARAATKGSPLTAFGRAIVSDEQIAQLGAQLKIAEEENRKLRAGDSTDQPTDPPSPAVTDPNDR